MLICDIQNLITGETTNSCSAEGAKLSGKYTDGYKELIWIQKKHRFINCIKTVKQNL